MAQQTELIFGLAVPVAIGAAAMAPLWFRRRAAEVSRGTTAELTTASLAVALAAGCALWGAGAPLALPPRTVTDRAWAALAAAALCAGAIQWVSRGRAEEGERGRGVRPLEGVACALLLALHLFLSLTPLAASTSDAAALYSHGVLLFSSFMLGWLTTSGLISATGVPESDQSGLSERLLRRAIPFLILIPAAGAGSLIALFSGTISLSVAGGAIAAAIGPFALLALRGPVRFPAGFTALFWPLVAALFTECALYAEVAPQPLLLHLLAPLALFGLRPDSRVGRTVIQLGLFGLLELAAIGLSAQEYLGGSGGY